MLSPERASSTGAEPTTPYEEGDISRVGEWQSTAQSVPCSDCRYGNMSMSAAVDVGNLVIVMLLPSL